MSRNRPSRASSSAGSRQDGGVPESRSASRGGPMRGKGKNAIRQRLTDTLTKHHAASLLSAEPAKDGERRAGASASRPGHFCSLDVRSGAFAGRDGQNCPRRPEPLPGKRVIFAMLLDRGETGFSSFNVREETRPMKKANNVGIKRPRFQKRFFRRFGG